MTACEPDKGLVFNIQRFCLHDGPGIRSVVFLKGCPLNCLWCSNPESQSAGPQLLYNRRLCRGCGRCQTVCPNGALRFSDHSVYVDRDRCLACGRCAASCPWLALTVSGREMTVDQVLAVVKKDWSFYKSSGGGVTLSGGEPCAQSAFALRLLEEIKSAGISTAIETSGYCPEETFLALTAVCDWVLFDIKALDVSAHKDFTGVDNRLILGNLRAIAGRTNVVARLPLIPGLNFQARYLEQVAEQLRDIPLAAVHLLPYHRLGSEKYEQLGRSYPGWEISVQSEEEKARLQRAAAGLFDAPVILGG